MTTEQLYLKPESLEQAAMYANEHIQDFRFIAGGTDVIVNKFQANDQSSVLIDLFGISELKKVVVTENQIEIGALVSLDSLKNYKILAETFPALIEAAQSVASPIIRKTATLGGNLLCENRCVFYNQSEWWRNAAGNCLKNNGNTCLATGGKGNCLSKFVSDTAVVLISLDACIEILENNETSVVPIESIYSGDGINPRYLNKNAIIKSIVLPLNNGTKTVYKKLRQRESIEFSSLSTAVSLSKNGKIKIVLGAVDPKPLVVEANVHSNLNELSISIAKKTRTIDNDAFSRKYRKQMIAVYLKKSFQELQLITP